MMLLGWVFALWFCVLTFASLRVARTALDGWRAAFTHPGHDACPGCERGDN